MSFLCISFVKNTALAAYLCTTPVADSLTDLKPSVQAWNPKVISSYDKGVDQAGLFQCWIPNNVWGEGIDMLHAFKTEKNVKMNEEKFDNIRVCAERHDEYAEQTGLMPPFHILKDTIALNQ